MEWLYWVSGVGLAIGAGMGLTSMINPRWGSRLVRLQADPDRPGGFAEFRGTYGGLFFFTHLLPLLFLFLGPGAAAPDSLGSGLYVWLLPGCIAIWWGTAVGRIISILVDRQGLPFNIASVGFELVLGLLIGAPFLAELLI
jgi:hypothetical protein